LLDRRASPVKIDVDPDAVLIQSGEKFKLFVIASGFCTDKLITVNIMIYYPRFALTGVNDDWFVKSTYLTVITSSSS